RTCGAHTHTREHVCTHTHTHTQKRTCVQPTTQKQNKSTTTHKHTPHYIVCDHTTHMSTANDKVSCSDTERAGLPSHVHSQTVLDRRWVCWNRQQKALSRDTGLHRLFMLSLSLSLSARHVA